MLSGERLGTGELILGASFQSQGRVAGGGVLEPACAPRLSPAHPFLAKDI